MYLFSISISIIRNIWVYHYKGQLQEYGGF